MSLVGSQIITATEHMERRIFVDVTLYILASLAFIIIWYKSQLVSVCYVEYSRRNKLSTFRKFVENEWHPAVHSL